MKYRSIAVPNVAAPQLMDAPINPEWIISGQPSAQAEWVAKSHDRTVSFVVWDCTCGTFQWHYDQDESFVVTAGEAFITQEGEPEYRLGPGDMAYCPGGSSCTWRVPNYVKKIAVLRANLPSSVTFFVRGRNRLMRILRHVGGRVPSPLSSPLATPQPSTVGGPLAESAVATSASAERMHANGVASPGSPWRVARHRISSIEPASRSHQNSIPGNEQIPDPETVEFRSGVSPDR